MNVKTIAQLLSAIQCDNHTDEKLDLLLSKIEGIEKAATNVEQDEHLLIDEVCELIKKSRVTLWSWRKKGWLQPFGKSGRSPIYKKSDVMNFLTNSKTINYVG